jgi:hypothetical protein
MPENPHHLTFANLSEAENHLGFVPIANRIPLDPEAVRAHIRDHRGREVVPTLEIYYDQFVLSQQRSSRLAATRLVEETYGPHRVETEVSGYPAVGYELGDVPDPTDPDPRQPSVVGWADGEFFCMLASAELELPDLLGIAHRLYDHGDGGD